MRPDDAEPTPDTIFSDPRWLSMEWRVAMGAAMGAAGEEADAAAMFRGAALDAAAFARSLPVEMDVLRSSSACFAAHLAAKAGDPDLAERIAVSFLESAVPLLPEAATTLARFRRLARPEPPEAGAAPRLLLRALRDAKAAAQGALAAAVYFLSAYRGAREAWIAVALAGALAACELGIVHCRSWLRRDFERALRGE